MPTAKKASQRNYRCDNCGWRWMVKRDNPPLEADCEKCGVVALCHPLPAGEIGRRFEALTQRLVKEDGPL